MTAKKLMAAILAAALLALPALAFGQTAQTVPATNLDGVSLHVEVDEELYPDPPVLVFYNGALTDTSEHFGIEGGRAYVSADWFKIAGAEVTSVGAGCEIALGGVVAKADDYHRVPLRRVAEELGMTAEWHGGGEANGAGTRMFVRGRQIIISSYPKDAKTLTTDECVAKLRDELTYAYTKICGEFHEWTLEDETSNFVGGEADRWRNFLTEGFENSLALAEENGRYCVFPMLGGKAGDYRDFWVDKYTGEIYNVYYGFSLYIWRFDKDADDAMLLAG